MQFGMKIGELAAYTARQLGFFYPDRRGVTAAELRPFVASALDRVEYCFKHITNAAYGDSKVARFDVLHADQYCTYIYYLANTIHRANGDTGILNKLFYLNKSMHTFNCMYDCELPDVVWLLHPIGSVIVKGTYRDYLVVRQNCTIGALGGVGPTIGERFIMSAGSSVVGPCRIGDNVMLGVGCHLIKTDVADDTMVVNTGVAALKPNSKRAVALHFRLPENEITELAA